MNDDVRVWALLIFSLCCCLLKDMITRLFRSPYCLRSKFTRAALVWRCVSYLRDRRAQYGSVQQGSAKSGLCTAITQVNYTRQPSSCSCSYFRKISSSSGCLPHGFRVPGLPFHMEHTFLSSPPAPPLPKFGRNQFRA